MESEHLLVWLAVPGTVMPIRSGLLCRRHADAMIVPRGWTLDDRREAMPRLFKVTEPASPNHPSRGRTRAKLEVAEADVPRQLEFDDAADAPVADATAPIVGVLGDAIDGIDRPGEPPPVMPVPDGLTVGDLASTDDDPDQTRALPWRPVFDDDDDLGGLLKAKSPLLARAFRTRNAQPPEPSSRSGDVDPGD